MPRREKSETREFIIPEAASVTDLIYYARGRVIADINEPASETARRHRALHIARALTEVMPNTPMITFQNARFRGILPQRPDAIARIDGSITGMAWEFKPEPYIEHRRGLTGRFVLALSLVDVEGYVTVDGQPYKADRAMEYQVNLAHSVGPIEEVA